MTELDQAFEPYVFSDEFLDAVNAPIKFGGYAALDRALADWAFLWDRTPALRCSRCSMVGMMLFYGVCRTCWVGSKRKRQHERNL